MSLGKKSIKPYANEHAARLQDPQKLSARTGFESVRRTHGSGKGKVNGVSVPAEIDVIWYVYKDGTIIPQALRFPIEHYTSTEAIAWLKSNKIEYLSFEKATNGKSLGSFAENYYNNLYLYKSLIGEIQDVDVKNGIVTGYFSAFNNIDHDREMIVPGSFSKTIQERGPTGRNKIMHLLHHDTEKPLSKPTVLKEDSKGLYFESKISATSYGKDTLLLYADKVYDEHSIGYRVMKWERVPKAGDPESVDYIKLLELFLYEGSTVSFGANDETPFTGFKSLSKEDQLTSLNKRMDKLFKSLKIGQLSDDTLASIEIQYKQVQQEINNVMTLNEKADQPLEDTGTIIEPDELFKAEEPVKKINLKSITNHLKI